MSSEGALTTRGDAIKGMKTHRVKAVYIERDSGQWAGRALFTPMFLKHWPGVFPKHREGLSRGLLGCKEDGLCWDGSV